MPCPFRETQVNQNKQPHRRPLRLQQYDYSQVGAYFITICVHNRQHLFGNIADGQMHLNDAGCVAEQCWIEIPRHFNFIELDEFVVMPNHMHGIIVISDIRRGTACRAPTLEQFGKPVPGSLPTIIRSFKSAVTRTVNTIRDTPGIPLWQRNYYEHVIRDEDALNRIREYIITNPMRWDLDRENPQRTGEDEFDKWLTAHKARPNKDRTKS